MGFLFLSPLWPLRFPRDVFLNKVWNVQFFSVAFTCYYRSPIDVVVRRGGGEAFRSSMTKSQFFREFVPCTVTFTGTYQSFLFFL